MPELCRFYGIVIVLRYREHPPPHFHAKYQEHEATVDMQNLRVTEGYLPNRAQTLVLEWASQHREELLEAWNTARSGQSPSKIAPLE